ncbi:MAG TPA: thioesterase family protein [Verrucomicrobiae bacterium]|nr:thioesterase family protein [Verrucomicrobiae bacterium]
MAYQFKIRRMVEFSDTDMAGIVHHAVYYRYMEAAEHAFFRSLGLTVAPPKTPASVGWPRVHTEADFSAPLRFEDEVEIHLLVAQKKSKALTYAFRLRKLNAPKPYEVARGKITVVCIKKVNGEMKATRIPKEIADKIQEAPARLLE